METRRDHDRTHRSLLTDETSEASKCPDGV